jgi:hypothetical protein
LASTLGLAAARAEPAAPTALSWHRLPGAEACPGLKEVALRVSAHLGRDPFATPSVASVFIEATIEPAPSGWTTQIDFSSTSGRNPSGQRKLESTEQECGPAADAAALAIALMIDPSALTRERTEEPPPASTVAVPEPPRPVAETRPAAAPVAPAATPCAPATLAYEPWRTRLAAGALVGVGQLPSATGGGWLGLRLSPAERRVGLEVAFAYLASREARVRAEAGGEFSSLSAAGAAFWTPLRQRRLALSFIGGVELGRILASGFGFQSFRSQGAWTLAPTADVELSFEIAPRWELLLRVGAGVPLLRDQFEFGLNGVSQLIFEPAPLFGRAAVGVGFGP